MLQFGGEVAILNRVVGAKKALCGSDAGCVHTHRVFCLGPTLKAESRSQKVRKWQHSRAVSLGADVSHLSIFVVTVGWSLWNRTVAGKPPKHVCDLLPSGVPWEMEVQVTEPGAAREPPGTGSQGTFSCARNHSSLLARSPGKAGIGLR